MEMEADINRMVFAQKLLVNLGKKQVICTGIVRISTTAVLLPTTVYTRFSYMYICTNIIL